MSDLTASALTRDAGKEITMNNAAASVTVDFSKPDEKLLLLVTNADAASATVTIKAGDGARSVIGDKAVAVAQNKTFVIGPFESSRFKGSTGKITATVTNADGTEYSGTITNVKIGVVTLP
jgi:hypothetical protein